jgi:hypothetical protein
MRIMSLSLTARTLLLCGVVGVVALLARDRWGQSRGLVMPGDDLGALIPFVAVETPSGEPDVRRWEARFRGPAGTAHFDIVLRVAAPEPGERFAFTRGSLRAREDSRADDLLAALARAHHSVRRVKAAARVTSLNVDTAILGQALSRGRGSDVLAGEFTSNPAGPWIVVKIFFTGQDAEMFIAFNPSANAGLFLPKDDEYWPDLEPLLASVL